MPKSLGPGRSHWHSQMTLTTRLGGDYPTPALILKSDDSDDDYQYEDGKWNAKNLLNPNPIGESGDVLSS